MSLEKSVVIITGGSRRVGLHCARTLRHLGCEVHITYRSDRPDIDVLRTEGVICHQVDFEEDDSLNRWLAFLRKDAPPMRALVHNASLWLPDSDPATDYQTTIRRMNRIHCEAPYLMNMAAAERLRLGGSPLSDIVHITDYVIEKGSDNHIAYAASKAALDGMTRSFAKRFAPLIKVNSIAPSLLMFQEDDDLEYRRKTLAKSALGVEPGPQVIADALIYLLNNRYMTGRVIALDGGRNIR